MTPRDVEDLAVSGHAPLAVELDDVAASLSRLAQEADGKLLAAGEGLRGLVGILDGLTRQFEALPQELDDPNLQKAADQIGSLAGEIAALGQALVEERTALSGLATLNGRTGAGIQQLRKTVHVITTLALNAQIEAAHVNVRGEDFSTFASDIVRLARTTEATANGYAREHERLTRILLAACETQAAFAGSHEATLRSAGQQLTATLETIEARRAQAAAAAAEIGRRSKRIGQEIGAAVMALQIGDITRQRVEHVGEAVNALRAGLAPGGTDAPRQSWADSLDAPTKSAVTATVCRMQSAQMAHAAAEFASEVDRIIASLKELSEESSTIVRQGSDVYGTAHQRDGSFLDGLRANLASAEGLVRDCQAARQQVDATVAALAASLRELLERLASVRGIEADMHLVGLNTALRCARLGSSGRTLSVVAQELRSYAYQTVQDADRLMAALRDITAAAEGFERDGQDRGAARIAALERVMATALGPFEESGIRLNQALSALRDQGGRVGEMLEEIAEGIAIHDTLGAAIKQAASRLDALASDVSLDAVDAELIRERIARFGTGRYTMQSERDIHARFVMGGAPNILVLEAGTLPHGSKSSLQDVLF